MRIAVLGGGHGAYAAAADLAEQGHEIRLWRRDAHALAPLLDNPTITLKDFHGRREVRIAQAGRIGLRTRSGFYDYTGIDVAAYRKDVISRTLTLLEHHGLLVPPGAALPPSARSQ